jgi:hypothetical protein
MRLLEIGWSFLVLLLFLLMGCGEDSEFSGYRASYEKLISVPQSERRCRYFSALPAAERVSIYMYGATRVEPSDYTLLDCLSEIDVNLWRELLSRLKKTKNSQEVFPLVIAMYGIVDSQIVYPVDASFRVSDYCQSDAHCLDLVRDIDKKLDAQKRDGLANKVAYPRAGHTDEHLGIPRLPAACLAPNGSTDVAGPKATGRCRSATSDVTATSSR